MNPCPCGYKNDKKIKCVCTNSQVRNYQKKISGPILDRFDIFLEIPQIAMKKIFDENTDEKDKVLTASIKRARELQRERFKLLNQINKNSDMTIDEIRKFCVLNEDAKLLLAQASERLNLSNRGYLRTLKIARTIADIQNSPSIKIPHIAEAIQYRKQN
jgi:magnesium chelatase family protein